MKKIGLVLVLIAALILCGFFYYNAKREVNTITDGTFISKGNEDCG